MHRKIDIEVLRTIAAQPLALITPLLIFRYIGIHWGEVYLVEVEALLSISSFLLIIQDFSTSTFFARNLRRITHSGMLTTVLIARLLLSISVGVVSAAICATIGYNVTFSISLVVILATFVFDFSWYFLGSGKSHYIPVILASRSIVTLIFLLGGQNPVMAIVSGYIVIAVLQAATCLKHFNLSPRVSTYFLRTCFARYRLPTVSELLTAAFSRLDAFFASTLLASADAVGYLTVRKYVLAASTVAMSGMKLLYVKAATESFASANRTYIFFSFSAVFAGALFAQSILKFLAPNAYDPGWIPAALVMLFILPIGYFKNRITYSIFYINRTYRQDLVCVVASNIWFLLSMFAMDRLSLNGPLPFASLRVGADLAYLICAAWFIYPLRAVRRR